MGELIFRRCPWMTSAIGLAIAHTPKAEPGNLKADISKARIFQVYLQFGSENVVYQMAGPASRNAQALMPPSTRMPEPVT